MKIIRHFNTARDKTLHIETEGGVINIQVGLTNARGQAVTSIEILPDTTENWHLTGALNIRLFKIVRPEK